jgi:2,4-dienoyl-CoA reductase-like NADH-dependent reductase (Old Yellow Enzyme family)
MLLGRVENYIKSRRMAPARFGREAVKDPKFVFQLREGREPRQRTVDRVLRYLDENQPEQG